MKIADEKFAGVGAGAKRVLVVTPHSVLDSTSGAAVSLLDLLGLLAERGWRCAVLCGSRMDDGRRCDEAYVARCGMRHVVRRGWEVGGERVELIDVRTRGVGVTVVNGAGNGAEERALVGLLPAALGEMRPAVMMTYGGGEGVRRVIGMSKATGARVVFWLRNCSYRDVRVFDGVDRVIVPSRFAREHYERLGVRSVALPSPVDVRRCRCERMERRTLTFVNPQYSKGVLIVSRLAEELAVRRPEVEVLVVEGRGSRAQLVEDGVTLADLPNVRFMANTADPREFLGPTRVLVLPSLWAETYARVAAEAIVNGIPVIGSRRGGIEDTLGDSGMVIDVPETLTPESRGRVDLEVVRPWVEGVVRLWEEELYQAEVARCVAAARRWEAGELMPRYEAVLGSR